MAGDVVVTGMGLSTSLGEGVKTNWEKLCSGSPSPLPSPQGRGSKGEGLNRAKTLAERATTVALSEAGLWDGQRIIGMDPARLGCTLSASKPLISPLPPATTPMAGVRQRLSGGRERSTPKGSGEGPYKVHPPDVINQFIRERFGLSGEARNVVAACATGAYAIALGASWIEAGLCDVVLAGSVETYPHPLLEAGFMRMGVVCRERVMRPFDRRRSGFVFGEGAAVVALESARHARSRGARAHARLSGWGLGSDAHSAVAFNSNGRHIAQVISQALTRARMTPAGIQHVNAHGTATRLNDWIETQALIEAFGEHAGRLMISATKASTGHLLGAAGSVEFIFTILALRHQYVPPTATLEEPDPDCPLDYTPGIGHAAPIEHALSLSFGFGGPIGALVVSKVWPLPTLGEADP